MAKKTKSKDKAPKTTQPVIETFPKHSPAWSLDWDDTAMQAERPKKKRRK